MNSVEIQARSVEEAVRLALEQLGRTEDEVDVEVLVDADPANEGEALVRVTAHGAASQPDHVSDRQPVAVANRPDEETEQMAKSVVTELLDAMGFDCQVMAVDNPSSIEVERDEPPTVFIDINGRDLGMLIGRRGENLSQFQYMVNLLVNKRLDIWTRVIVDVEGYRVRREESLIGLANRVARQVARNRRPISLEPMPANERRVVHMALRNDPLVTTASSGEAGERRVTVQLKSNS
jgi:spoIIIJ-associated protein